jgi:hypothetical protein
MASGCGSPVRAASARELRTRKSRPWPAAAAASYCEQIVAAEQAFGPEDIRLAGYLRQAADILAVVLPLLLEDHVQALQHGVVFPRMAGAGGREAVPLQLPAGLPPSACHARPSA